MLCLGYVCPVSAAWLLSVCCGVVGACLMRVCVVFVVCLFCWLLCVCFVCAVCQDCGCYTRAPSA